MAPFFSASLALFAASLVTALGPQPPHHRPNNLPTYTSPSTGILNGSHFSAWVSSQAVEGQTAVALAPGRYHVTSPDPSYGAYIVLQHLTDITVWMDRVNMSMADNTVTALNVESCSNLTTYGPSLWWDVPGFGQATITAVTQQADSTYEVEFHLDDGYNSSTLLSNGVLNGEYTSPFTGRLQAGPGWSTFGGTATAVSGKPNTYSFSYTDGYFAPRVGYKILSRGQFLFCNQVQSSNHTTLNDFTMHNCGGFGFFSSSNRKTTFNSFTLKPAHFPPPGGTELPARSSSADGIHSADDFVGPTIDSAYFAALDDDCIAIHGSLANATGRSGNTFAGTQSAFPGDILRFYSPNSFIPLGTSRVTSSSTTDPNSPADITVDQLPTSFTGGSIPYVNQNRVGSGFAIRNTHTTGNRGRGAIVKASNGVIENNVFEGVSYAALYLGPEFSDWREADYVHNLTVTNNTIRDCSYLSKATSAFDLHGDSDAEGSEDSADNPVTGNSNIHVSGLRISGSGSHSNLYVGAAHNVRLQGVVIEHALASNYTLWETTPSSIVTFQNAAFVGPVGICIRGGVHLSGVQAMETYGNVTGAPTDLGKC